MENCIQTCKLPMWNAIFCGVSSKYTNRGICTSLYQRALDIMTQHYNNFHGNRRRSCQVDYGNPLRLKVRKMSFENDCAKETVPLLVSVSHSNRSSRFHSKNGFRPMKAIPYKAQDGEIPFNVHILAHEPFNCGKSKLFAASLNFCVTSNNSKNEVLNVDI